MIRWQLNLVLLLDATAQDQFIGLFLFAREDFGLFIPMVLLFCSFDFRQRKMTLKIVPNHTFSSERCNLTEETMEGKLYVDNIFIHMYLWYQCYSYTGSRALFPVRIEFSFMLSWFINIQL